jgi:hypothetical protein
MAPRCVIAEAKQRSQRRVIGWVTKTYYLELLRTSEGTVGPGCICSRLYPLQFQGGLTSGGRPVVKTIAESLSQHAENMLFRPHLVG